MCCVKSRYWQSRGNSRTPLKLLMDNVVRVYVEYQVGRRRRTWQTWKSSILIRECNFREGRIYSIHKVGVHLKYKFRITRHLHFVACCLSRKVLKKIRRRCIKTKITFWRVPLNSSTELSNWEFFGELINVERGLFANATAPSVWASQLSMLQPYHLVLKSSIGLKRDLS
jgi:hypothetical protein